MFLAHYPLCFSLYMFYVRKSVCLNQYNISAVMNDLRSINLGSVYESVVCSELSAHGFPLFYYDNKKRGFLVSLFGEG